MSTLEVTSPVDLAKIRTLNDRLRTQFLGGSIVLTQAVATLEENQKIALLAAMRGFTSFDDSNDPHGEHDLWIVEINGERFMGKIDYFAPDMQHSSEDPSDPEKTRRVLTIMQASDY